ncbi:zf-ZPR1-domain-containing protein [Pisolithus croceorrhizus]|nr:zf-ZPR1-domain-containing protein [Pisolithus croceorrhizus]
MMSCRWGYCSATSNEVQSACAIRDEGVLYTLKLKVLHRAGLDRQIVRSAACTGLLRDIAADLTSDQPVRRILDEAPYTEIQQDIDGIKEILGDEEEVEDEAGEARQGSSATGKNKEDPVKKVITIQLGDLSGNSFAEFLGGISAYARNLEQNHVLGLLSLEEPSTEHKGTSEEKTEADSEGARDTNEEIYECAGVCSRCVHPLLTRMKEVSIPYFKDTLIMSTNCEHCGYRGNEVKLRITLRTENRDDLSRDILKSEMCGLTIPEIDLTLQPGTPCGRFTTIEGILEQVYEELSEKVYTTWDSSTMMDENRQKVSRLLEAVKRESIYVDPRRSSYPQNLYAPDPDPNMDTTRSRLDDMKVANMYIADDASETKEEKRINEVVS